MVWFDVMADVFLSYNRDDQATARRFAEGLQRAGISVWWDQSLRSGEAFDRVTEKALAEASAVVVLWSKKSVESRWVRAEATQADQSGKLMPVTIEPSKRPIMFELTHTADLSGWQGGTDDPRWVAFVGDVRSRIMKHDVAPSLSPTNTPQIARDPTAPRRWLPVALAAAALLLLAGGTWFLRGNRVENPAAAVTPGPVADKTLAVLPFVNLSSDPEQEYFSDGLTEEILNQLAQIKALRVTGRTSSFSFKGKNIDLREIGRQLDVAHLLEGSVRKDGDMLRITAQLIDARDGAHVWSQTYDRERRNVFAVQEELARDVATALSISLDVGELSRSQGGTTNVAAYEKYVQGLGGGDSRLGIADVVQRFRDAVALDPDFALAWYRLYTALPAMANAQRAEAAAATLKERDEVGRRLALLLPESGRLASVYRAEKAYWEHRWTDVFAELQPLQAASPGDWEVNDRLSVALRAVGRANDAISSLQRVVTMEPLNFNASNHLMRWLRLAGRKTEADAEFSRGNSLGGGGEAWQELFEVWNAATDPSPKPEWKAVSARLERIADTTPPGMGRAALFRVAASHPDDVAAARAALRAELDKPENQGEGQLSMLALLADLAGDRALTVAALRRSYIDLQSGWLPNLWERTVASGVREDSGFKQLLRDLRIVDYWRESGNWADFCKPVGADDFECR
jgi:TolB-like protein